MLTAPNGKRRATLAWKTGVNQSTDHGPGILTAVSTAWKGLNRDLRPDVNVSKAFQCRYLVKRSMNGF